jgi:serine protease inhibitor ecotin
VLSATIHPDLKCTLVAMSVRTGMSVSQVSDEVLYTGLIEMQELEGWGEEYWGLLSIHKVVKLIYAC